MFVLKTEKQLMFCKWAEGRANLNQPLKFKYVTVTERLYFIKENFKLHVYTFENLFKCTIITSSRYLN